MAVGLGDLELAQVGRDGDRACGECGSSDNIEIVRGKVRDIGFHRVAREVVFPLIPSIFHRFTCYAGIVDAGSGYGRLYPAHHMTAAVATATLEAFTAEMGAHMGCWAAVSYTGRR